MRILDSGVLHSLHGTAHHFLRLSLSSPPSLHNQWNPHFPALLVAPLRLNTPHQLSSSQKTEEDFLAPGLFKVVLKARFFFHLACFLHWPLWLLAGLHRPHSIPITMHPVSQVTRLKFKVRILSETQAFKV